MTETITFTIDSGISGNINNYAEISSDDGDDCDSIPDQDNTNDALTNDEIGSRCDINPDDEDDHDIETITVGTVVSACTNLSASPTSAKDSLTSALSCTGNNATSYLIEVKNSGGTVVYSQASATGNVTLTSE